MKSLHEGKLSEEAKISLPEGMHRLIKEMANKSQCFASEIMLDAIFLGLTHKTYSEHIANDRRALFELEGRAEGDSSAPKGSADGE